MQENVIFQNYKKVINFTSSEVHFVYKFLHDKVHHYAKFREQFRVSPPSLQVFPDRVKD